ncbi:exonuclease subunit SbcD [Chitinivorax sp. B]|uniref:exonuclease subunit SbcD n=1 Tax=Chitinivorax sp. B TaxID=2502235 RepID=UPI0010F75C54|nr:exonuclease subunit SbcD [Chitinivorax sp. B]
MRILHTSDWHLGQYFMGKTRQAEHQALITWLAEQVEKHQIDAVLLAGDVFDSGTPPSYARSLYYDLIMAMKSVGTTLVVLGGNHDSVATLMESKRLLRAFHTHVIPGVLDEPADQVLVLSDRHGQPGAVLCAIPYIRPRDVLQSQAGQSAEDKLRSLQQAIQQHYQQLFLQAQQRCDQLGGGLPIIATGHLTTVGASASESVREIYVGALEAFPTQAFPAADYIALGHIHRPQWVGGLTHVRYSGSPIALSFDEATQDKLMWLVELDSTGLQQVSPLAVPCFQPLMSITGSLDTLPALLQSAALQGTADHPVWLEVVVRVDDYLSDLTTRVQAMADGLAVDILRVRRERGQAKSVLLPNACEMLDELTPLDVFERRLAQESLDDALHAQLRLRYRQVISQLQGADA